ncbi:MAG: hypothetical protein R2744_05295 [Bacteroidales bacterium]
MGQIEYRTFPFYIPESYRAEAARASLVYENAYSILHGTLNDRPLKDYRLYFITIQLNQMAMWHGHRAARTIPPSPQDNLPMGDHEHQPSMKLPILCRCSLFTGAFHCLRDTCKRNSILVPRIFTPFWFLEGNAVISESVFSESGRGRSSPLFEKQMKALLLDKGAYSYDKMINGSFRDYVPDHYQFSLPDECLGISISRKRYLEQRDAVHRQDPYSANPFNLSLRRDYNITKKKDLPKETMSSLTDRWGREDSLLMKVPFDTVIGAKKGKICQLPLTGKDRRRQDRCRKNNMTRNT